MSVRRQVQRGFTLLEVVVAMAIVAVLSSMAIPFLGELQLRAKSAERKYLMQAIYRSVDDLYAREGQFPTDLGGGDSMLDLTAEQPTATPSRDKIPWRMAPADPSDQWNTLALTVEGAVYYRYGGVASVVGNVREYHLWARGDLDGDGLENRWDKYWRWNGSTKQIDVGSTLDCSDCSLATETGATTW